MNAVRVFGKTVKVREEKSDKDLVEFRNGRILIATHGKRPANSLLNEFLEDLLHSKLSKIYERIRNEGKIELFGDLEFEVVERIDGRKGRLAKLKGNKIWVKLSVVTCPDSALEYVVAHEIAHIFTKRHSKRFWRVLETICPDFEEGQRLLTEYHEFLVAPTTMS